MVKVDTRRNAKAHTDNYRSIKFDNVQKSGGLSLK